MAHQSLQFGIAPPNWGAFGNPRQAAELARVAENAGWHGYFTWDALIVTKDPPPTFDPWLILTAMALATEQIRIGTCVAVVPRYNGDGRRNFDAFGEAGGARPGRPGPPR